MDVNGTRFQLLRGADDWSRCGETPDTAGGANLSLCGEARDTAGGATPASVWQHTCWDAASQNVTLRRQLSLFRHRKRNVPFSLTARRGAEADANGNWFWISHDQRAIYWLPSGTNVPAVYWSQEPEASCPPTATFNPVTPEAPVVTRLAGLAITEHQFLVVGNLSEPGVLRFDLRAGGDPGRLRFPADRPFAPFDMAAAPGGGVWILDREHNNYWGLDAQFRVLGSAPPLGPPNSAAPAPFQPVCGAESAATGTADASVGDPGAAGRPFPQGFDLASMDPIAIESLPDGSVLILDSPDLEAVSLTAPASSLWWYRLGQPQAGPLALHADLEVAVEGQDVPLQGLDVIGFDIAYLSGSRTLYVVEHDGTQVISFGLDWTAAPLRLHATADYLPLYYFGGRAVITRGTDVYYDVTGGDPTVDANVRWLPVQSIDQPRYDRETTLVTPIFDGRQTDCVWHRLFLDACIPPATAVTVTTRANNDAGLLLATPFQAEPGLYLRDAGAEIPYYDPFLGETPATEKGTWELLFQQAHGRYLQIQLTLAGNGQASPELRALRAYYPRFSYPRHYLPAVYLQDAESADFLERLMANPEGFLSEIEGKINDAGVLFDPRSAPPEALDWLASWVGLALDPIWADLQQRRQQASASQSMAPGATTPAPDRRRLFIRFAYRLYDRRGTMNGMQLALHLLLDPCLEATLDLLKRAAIAPAGSVTMDSPANAEAQQIASLRALLKRLNLPAPAPVMDDADLEDLLAALILSADSPAQIRIVERFRTRGGRQAAEGDPTVMTTDNSISATAHRFSVLLPAGLMPEELSMVNRLVELEKPAHTMFDVGSYWNLFVVGQARLGIDSVIGASGQFVLMQIGQNALGTGYLGSRPPMDALDRFVTDRDRIGELPAL